MTALGIEPYKIAGYILDACLRAFLKTVPRTGSEGRKARRLASILTAIL